MVGDEHGDIAPLQPSSAQPHDAVLGAEDGFGGGGTQGADCLRPDHLKLAEQELPANLHFVGLGCPVLRRAALDYVADVNLLTLQRDALFGGGSFDHLREKLSCPADERQSLLVLVGPRAFTYKHQPRLCIAGTKHDPIPALMQATAFAVSNIFAYFG